MRQRQRGFSGVENAPTCMGGLGLPSTPAVPSTPRPATASSPAAKARGLGELHTQPPPIQLLAVELFDRRLGLFGRRHLDEAETARAPGLPVHYDCRRLNCTGLGEDVAEPLVRRRKRQASDGELLCHDPPSDEGLPRLKTLPGTRKTAPETGLVREGVRVEPTPRPDCTSVAHLARADALSSSWSSQRGHHDGWVAQLNWSLHGERVRSGSIGRCDDFRWMVREILGGPRDRPGHGEYTRVRSRRGYCPP